MPALNTNDYAYIIPPSAQFRDLNGEPYSAGFVEFYKHGTSEKYITYADWAGSFNPFRIPLNSQGRGIAIAEKDVILDMYVYNYLGNLAYSRLNVRTTEDQDGTPLRFTSSDGSVIITRVDNVVDLTVFRDEQIYGAAEADSVSSSGVIEFDNIKSGDITVISAGTLRIGLGKLYHVTVALEFSTTTVNPLYCDCQLTDSENTVHKFTLDASRTKQMVELSWDAVSSSDTFQITIQAPSIFSVTSADLYIHAVNPVVGGSAPQMQSDWEVTDVDSPAFIKNKPDLSVYARIADLAAVAFSGDYDDLSGKPDLSVFARTADLASVAFSGSYNDLSNIPEHLVQDADYVHTDNNFTTTEKNKLANIEAGAEVNVQANWNESDTSSDAYIQNKPDLSRYALIADLAAVAFSGAYSDLSGAPDLGVYTPKDAVAADWVSGTVIANGAYRWSNDKVYRAKKYLSAANNTTAPHLDSTNWEQVSIISASSALYHYFEASTGPTLSSTQVLTAIASGRPLYLVEYTTSGTSRSYGKAYGLVYYGNQGSNDIIFGTMFQQLQPDQTTKQWIFGWRKLHYVPSVSDPTASDTWTTGSTSLGVFYHAGTGISIVDRTDGDKTINCTLDPFPNHTAADEDKVLTVDNANALIWKAVAAVAYSGSYNDLSNKPTIPPAQVQSDWTETDDTKKSFILNKPTKTFITAGQNVSIVEVDNQLVISAAGGGSGTVTDVTVNGTSVVDSNGVAVIDLTPYVLASALATVATTGDYSDLSNTPDLSVYALISSLAAVATSGDYTDLSNKPDLSVYALASSLAAVATSGSYSDLSNKPDLSVYALASSLATVATSGSYNDLSDKPTIPTITYTTSQEVTDILADLT